jgi:SHS2 domain-containing protein
MSELEVGRAEQQQPQQQRPQQQQRPSGLIQEQTEGRRDEQTASGQQGGKLSRSGEPDLPSAPSETEQGVGQPSELGQQQHGGQGQQRGEVGHLTGQAGQAAFAVGPVVEQQQTSIGKEIPVTRGPKQERQKQGGSKVPVQAPELQTEKSRQPPTPTINEPSDIESEKVASSRGPGPSKLPNQPGFGAGSQSLKDQGEETAPLFYAHGEGHKGSPDISQQLQQSGHEAQSQSATYERSDPSRHRQDRLESEKVASSRGPGSSKLESQSGLGEGSQTPKSPDEESARLFYAQGEGYQGIPELSKQQAPRPQPQLHQRSPEILQQQQQQSGREAQSQTATYERSDPSRDRQDRLRKELMPGQESAELRSTTGQGGRFGREERSAVAAPVRSKQVPQSNISGLASNVAQMQFPREEGSHEMIEKSLQQGKQQPEQTLQPGKQQTEKSLQQGKQQPSGSTASESGKEHIGLGAESGRSVEYEYLPHPADIQFHSWGSTKIKAFEHMADCMFNYLADTEKVDIDRRCDFKFEVIGEDDKELLYKFLDELLFRFNTRKQIICKRVSVNYMGADPAGYRLHAIGQGEPYKAEKHGSGTEIKAITLASLQVNEQPGRTEAYVIVDI